MERPGNESVHVIAYVITVFCLNIIIINTYCELQEQNNERVYLGNSSYCSLYFTKLKLDFKFWVHFLVEA